MPKYKVNRAIEHNQTLYLPQGWAAPPKVKSAGTGQDIPVDTSGTIEVDEEQAKALVHGPISPIAEAPSPPAVSKEPTDGRPAAEVK